MREIFVELEKQIVNNWLIVGIFAMFLISRIFAFVKSGKLKKLSVGKISAEFGNAYKCDADIKKIPPHKDCPYVSDLATLVMKVSTMSARTITLKTHVVISLQMNFAEENFLLLKKKMLDRYMSALGGVINSERLSMDFHYKNYSLGLSVLIHSTLDSIKAVFLRDDFITVSLDTDNINIFLGMITDQIVKIKGTISEFFDANYTGDVVISRNDLQTIHETSYDDIETTTSRVFNNARRILVDKNKEVEIIERDLKKYLVECIGLTNEISFDNY